ncbi:hypothetical protein TIFTF001_045638 [Ficus carica]|uniref:Transposase (putative) gypsy type domain-containing protein n=1 Tax=Ficus carica TaxID=3494 RepID=A0AA87Z6F4_FICCA|nr:hypothetical protein TIFTF001_045638 [Ficus carica]
MKTRNNIDEKEFQSTIAPSHNHSSTRPSTRTKHRANRVRYICESDNSSDASASDGSLHVLDPKDDLTIKGKGSKEKDNISHEANNLHPPHVRQNYLKKKNITLKIKLSNASTKVDTQPFSPESASNPEQALGSNSPVDNPDVECSSNPLTHHAELGLEISPSCLTKADLDNLRDTYHVPPIIELRLPLPNETPETPPPNGIAIFDEFLKSGLRLPLHPFIHDVLISYNLSLGQICPNALRHVIACFVLWRKLGFEDLTVAEFKNIYTKKKSPKYANFFHLQTRPNMKIILDCSDKENRWRHSWFFAIGDWDITPSNVFSNLTPSSFQESGSEEAKPLLSKKAQENIDAAKIVDPSIRSRRYLLSQDVLETYWFHDLAALPTSPSSNHDPYEWLDGIPNQIDGSQSQGGPWPLLDLSCSLSDFGSFLDDPILSVFQPVGLEEFNIDMTSDRSLQSPFDQRNHTQNNSRVPLIIENRPRDWRSRLQSRPIKPSDPPSFDPNVLKERAKKRKTSDGLPPLPPERTSSYIPNICESKEDLLPSSKTSKNSTSKEKLVAPVETLSDELLNLQINSCYVPIIETIQRAVSPERINAIKKREYFRLCEANARRASELLSDILISTSRARDMFEEARSVMSESKILEGKLLNSENATKLAQNASTEWESKYQTLFTSSENDKKILEELKVSLEETQKKLETTSTELDRVKKELDFVNTKSEEDWSEVNKYYAWAQAKIDSEYWEGFDQAKQAILELNPGIKLNLDIDSCRRDGASTSQSPFVASPQFDPRKGDFVVISPMRNLEKTANCDLPSADADPPINSPTDA